MRFIQPTETTTTGIKFVISCQYFNEADKPTHSTDLIVDLSQKKLNRIDIDKIKTATAA